MAESNNYYKSKFYHIYQKSKFEILNDHFDTEEVTLIISIDGADGLPNVIKIKDDYDDKTYN